METKSQYNQAQDLLTESDLQTSLVYAGFWLRVAAFLIDISPILFISLLANLSDFYSTGYNGDDTVGIIMGFVIIGYVGYFPLMEGSVWQATLGKRVVGIKVTTLQGERIDASRALGRCFCRILSHIFLGTGYIMAGFTEKRQAMHDIIAGTLVVKD